MSVSVEVGDGKVPAGSLPVPEHQGPLAPLLRQRMGSRDEATIWPSVPWAFRKDLTEVSPLSPPCMSSLGLGKACQGDPSRVPTLLLLHPPDLKQPWCCS